VRHLQLWLAALAVAFAGLTTPAQAQNWYFGPEGGWTNLEEVTNRHSNGVVLRETFNNDYNVGARAGYQAGPWRFEGEFSYRQNSLGTLNETSPMSVHFPDAKGDRYGYAEMANAIYDFNVGWPFTPHIGAGVGADEQTQNATTHAGATHSSDTVFAYQAIGGFEWNLSPALALDLDYRYFATLDPHFRTTAGVGITSSYSSHNIVASLVYRFGPGPAAAPPAPPMPPAPPPMARRVFLVFFDWDRDTITPDGMAVLRQAAAAWRSGAPVQIQVIGYTDRSGSPQYNQRLSERRANKVAIALVGLGVPRERMAVNGRGENDNRVPTANGVREPQNRRVEIVFP